MPSQAPDASPRLFVLMTAHNRKAQTLACLERLAEQSGDLPVEMTVVLVDDASTDGTGDAVRARFPDVHVVEGSGQLYWNGGMRKAFEVAMQHDPAYYLFLNDDTHLSPGALARVLATHAERTRATGQPCVVVGSTVDPETARLSYGGFLRGPWYNRGRFERIDPGPVAKRCHTMNGNCVLVPREAARRVGNLDETFVHSMGDLDYGLRALRRGCALWVAPGYVGECVANSGKGLFIEASLRPQEIWKRLIGPKGLPPAEWIVFTSRHYGPFWPVNFVWPYAKSAWRALRAWRGGR